MDMNESGWDKIKDYYKNIIFYFHGYNVDHQDAINRNRCMFRRLYWSGYRGNYVGISWDGSSAGTVHFFQNMRNAMQTAPVVYEYFKTKIQQDRQFSPENITFMAHSLGNQVMWDILRIYAHEFPDTVAVQNTVSIEAAVWEEAFSDYGRIEYKTCTPHLKYETTDLEKHSWAYWFNQPGHEATRAVSTRINSYLTSDKILALMRAADLGQKSKPYDYFRQRIDSTSRTMEKLWSIIPAMVRGECNPCPSGIGTSGPNDGSRPLGIVSDHKPFPNGFAGQLQFTYFDAKFRGWRENNHHDCVDLPYQAIYDWFDKILLECKLVKEKE